MHSPSRRVRGAQHPQFIGKKLMRAMVLTAPDTPLRMEERELPSPGSGQVRVRISACGVCRTDLHVVDGELPDIPYPIIPGHEIVGRVEAVGDDVVDLRAGERVGVPWLGHTCGTCRYCRAGMENLCDHALFTGYTRDGGFATHAIADARYAFPLGEDGDDGAAAPLLCAGLIGWRSLVMAGDAERLGIYASAPPGTSSPRWRAGRAARSMPSRAPATGGTGFRAQACAVWAGPSDTLPPMRWMPRIIYAPVGGLVPRRCERYQGRPRGLRRHPHERHSVVPYAAVGRAAARLRRQSDAARRAGFLKSRRRRHPYRDHDISAGAGERGAGAAALG